VCLVRSLAVTPKSFLTAVIAAKPGLHCAILGNTTLTNRVCGFRVLIRSQCRQMSPGPGNERSRNVTQNKWLVRICRFNVATGVPRPGQARVKAGLRLERRSEADERSRNVTETKPVARICRYTMAAGVPRRGVMGTRPGLRAKRWREADERTRNVTETETLTEICRELAR
jgi:hypothetical protein